MKNEKFTFSPFGNVVQNTSDHIRIPVVSLSDPPRHENPRKGLFSSPSQLEVLCLCGERYYK